MSADHSSASRPRRLVRTTIGAAIGLATLVGLGAGATDAAPRTTSTVIATEAAAAVESLDRWHETRQPIDYVRFVQHRDRAASLAESDLELERGALRSAWDEVALPKQEALLHAVSQLGVPYRNLASEPGVGFDCSGLTIWAFGEAGVEIPRVSRDQIRAAEEVDEGQAEAGDLVYYPGHISIYLGADMMVHSPNSGNHVEITDLPGKTLRFGDADAAHRAEAVAAGSLMDRALAVSE